ncbi:hypothetical protein D5R81_02350 [Parashewanella spongiae]|uniref:Peptidase S8 n=1 Tax=Parashewanella spongiae TaxID=342950 RepID=A0A3A6U0Z5_9GAMM|nr:S8 family serine peptidase [Parashewanella spongiae]MCL1077002.1 S8 family serine peptidase [Parashewanella spongiae]RJY19107.1 hypothetical protein D5R81_02350 [Parashewanella spongiae]
MVSKFKKNAIQLAVAVLFALFGTNNAVANNRLQNTNINPPTNNSAHPVKRYIVQFKDQTYSPAHFGTQPSMSHSAQNTQVQLQRSAFREAKVATATRIGHSNSYSASLSENEVRNLQANKNIEFIEEDVLRYALNNTLSTQHTSKQSINRNMKSSLLSDISWGNEAVDALSLTDASASNRTVCIIDTGYDVNHPALANNNVIGESMGNTGSWDAPGNPHGTHVAGIISAMKPLNHSDDFGIRGVMPHGKVNIVAIKALNDQGQAYNSDIMSAVETCADLGANVISMSLGGIDTSRAEKKLYNKYSRQGILIVAAAGNSGDTSKSYPASYSSVMSVASIDSGNAHSVFSQSNNQVEISAPGEAIISSVPVGQGRTADISVEGHSYFANGVVPAQHYIPSGPVDIDGNIQYMISNINDTAAGELAECDTSSGSYQCENMTSKVCLVQRLENQGMNPNAKSTDEINPEIHAVSACQQAGAVATIVYSNDELSGLQNPFLVDKNQEISSVTVSVDRETGQELASHIGEQTTVSAEGNKDYEYFNGTSMATPYVSGVATLLWSHHTECSAQDVRNALDETAKHLGQYGRNNQFGYGLIDAEAADEYLTASCKG